MIWLLAPFYALFSLEFYRRVLQRPLSQAFLHFLLLTVLAGLSLSAYISLHLTPQARDFVAWLGDETPPLTWTPEGFVMNARSPYAMVHPDLGTLATFDMTRESVEEKDLEDGILFFTPKKVYVRFGPGDVRVYDVTRSPENMPPEQLVMKIDADFFDWVFMRVRPWLVAAGYLFFLPFFFISKIFETLLFSFAAFFINKMRRPPLPFSRLFTLTAFTITAASLFELAGFLWPVLRVFPLGFAGPLLLNGGYLYWALKKTEESLPDPI